MYHYLLSAYQQWCSGKGDIEIYNEGEQFIDVVHKLMRYDKDNARQFLVNQPWFISKVNKDPL